MKKVLLVCFCAFQLAAFSQIKSFTSMSGEIIFSFASIKDHGKTESSNLRWSPVFNLQALRNHDFGANAGMFYGFSVRNVGFIYEKNSDTLNKYRTYNVGIPIGIKLGKMDGFFVYGGYEVETPFHYKEKLFINDDKKSDETISLWFNHRYVQSINQSVFAGINFKNGFNIKFKYYLNNFFNKSAERTTQGITYQPFKNLEANVFYIAINWDMFKDVKEKRNRKPKKPTNDNVNYSYRF